MKNDKNEYMRNYMINRYHNRMEAAITYLGGNCTTCGSKSNLQLDHIDRSSKAFTIGGSGWNLSEKLFWKEVDKCQLLCRSCHNEKTLRELGLKSAKGTHGTLSALRYCKPPCYDCREAKRNYNRKYRLSLTSRAPSF